MADDTPRAVPPAPDQGASNKPAQTVPDPHRGTDAPPPEEGLRPEAAAAGVRPAQDEPLGPQVELLKAVGMEAKEELPGDPDPETEAELTRAGVNVPAAEAEGVEAEGIESGQMLGIIVSVALGILTLVLILLFVFIEPLSDVVLSEAEDTEVSIEAVELEIEARDLLGNYALNEDSTYRVPIGRAMGLVAGRYGTLSDSVAAVEAGALPSTRQRFNTAPVDYTSPGAVQVGRRPALVDPASSFGGESPAESGLTTTDERTNEEVGADDIEPGGEDEAEPFVNPEDRSLIPEP